MKIYNLCKDHLSWMRLLRASEHVHTYPTNANKYGVGVRVNVEHYVNQGILDSIMNKYADKISQAVRNMRKK